jgi:hypothetical protein
LKSPPLGAAKNVNAKKSEPVSFAVLNATGLSSNSWRVWVSNETIYIKCRDNFQEVKVSLHPSKLREKGRWRVGFTREAIGKIGRLLPGDRDRAWDVWDEPSAHLPHAVVAFKLLFPTSELTITPEKRNTKVWDSNKVFIEAAPPGKLTVVTLFVTEGPQTLTHATEPSMNFARLPIYDNRYAQLVAHGELVGNLMQVIEKAVAQARLRMREGEIEIPETAYGYFLGQLDDGCRYIVGARVSRQPVDP